jgi:hypothetical protein
MGKNKSEKWLSIAGTALFFSIAVLFAWYYSHLRWVLDGQYYLGGLLDMIEGKAHFVFQQRMLVPWIVAKISGLDFFSSIDHIKLKTYFCIELVSAFLLIVIFRQYLRQFIGNAALSSMLAFSIFYPLIFNYLFPGNFDISFDYTLPSVYYYPQNVNLYYPYDTPSIAFFTLGMLLIYRKNWYAFYPLFAIATLNRETTCFLTFIYLFTTFGRERHLRILLHCGSQLVIWIIIKAALGYTYASTTGKVYDIGLSYNFNTLLDPMSYYYIFSNMGYIWIPAVLFHRRIGHEHPRRALLVLIPFTIASLSISKLTELRSFGEIIPIVMTAFLLILKGSFDRCSPSSKPPKNYPSPV